jgi:hypothetical protein
MQQSVVQVMHVSDTAGGLIGVAIFVAFVVLLYRHTPPKDDDQHTP